MSESAVEPKDDERPLFRRILLPDVCKPNLAKLRVSGPPVYRLNAEGVAERVTFARQSRTTWTSSGAGVRKRKRVKKHGVVM